MAGLHAEIRTMFAQSAQNYIVASRVAQGNEDHKSSSPQERHDIETRWLSQKDDLKAYFLWKQKEKGKTRDPYSSGPTSIHGAESSESVTGDEAPKTGWLHTKNMTWEERKRLQEQKRAWKKKQAAAAAQLASGSHVTEDVTPGQQGSNVGLRDDEFEQAIRAAVAETSRGDPFEDARVEQAIRSSIMELKRRSSVSLASTASHQSDGQSSSNYSQTTPPTTHYGFPSELKGQVPFSPEDLENITDEEYQALIEQAVQLSVAEDERRAIRMHDVEEEDEDDNDYKLALERSETERTSAATAEEEELLKKALEASEAEHAAQAQHGGDGADDEEEIRKAIEASQAEHARQQSVGEGNDDEDALKRAIEESERAHQEELARVSAQQTEEDIILEYIKKQSLAEEEYRLKGKGKEATGHEDDDDEELKKAIEESIKASGKVGESSGSGSGGKGKPPTGGSTVNELPG
jgi:hypothetical protein